MVLFFRVLTRLFVLALAYILAVCAGLAPTTQPPQQDIIITLAAGFVAGFTYWLIAGRSAGNWRSQITL